MIRKRIKEKFGTIENFAKQMNVPRTTINFILKNGVASSSYDMVVKILKALDIYSAGEMPLAIDDDVIRLIENYNALDEMGKHAVKSVAETEYRRMHPNFIQDAIIAAYGSIDSSNPLTKDEKLILDLVEKIKKEYDEK